MNGIFTTLIAAGLVLSLLGVLPVTTYLLLLAVGAVALKQMKIS